MDVLGETGELYVVRSGWGVGGGWSEKQHRASGSCNAQKPPPSTLPSREGRLSAAGRKSRTFRRSQLQVASHGPHAAFHRFPGRGRPRSGDHAARTPRLRRRRPTATSHALGGAAPPPSPRTTNNAPRTRRADTRVRPYDEITRTTSHEPQLQATSYKPHAAIWSFQPSYMARASQSRPAYPPSPASAVENGDSEAT